MALEEFENERISAKDKGIIRMRSITNYVMGASLLVVGLFLFSSKALTIPQLQRYDVTTLRLFGGVCCIYGLFRIYRGYRKNYFRES